MQIKNTSQSVDSKQSATEPSFNANQLDSVQATLDGTYCPGPGFQGWVPAAAMAYRSPTCPFDSSCALSSGSYNAPAVGASSSHQFFGAPSKPAAHASSTPSFGVHSVPAFGASNTPSFGAQSTPAFGSSTSLSFGAQSTPALGVQSTPAFGVSSTPPFGAPNSPSFGAQSTPLGYFNNPSFGVPSFPSNATTFGASSTPPFGASYSPSFGAQITPAVGSFNDPSFGATTFFGGSSTTGPIKTYPDQCGAPTNSVFGRSIPATNNSYSAFCPPTTGLFHSPFNRTTTGVFGSASSSARCSFPNGSSSQLPGDGFNFSPWGSFNSVYQMQGIHKANANSHAQIYDEDGHKLQSISAMLARQGIDMSHEELRWIDYQRSNKGNCVSNSPWIKTTITNSKSGCENVQSPPSMSNTTKSNMISISINIEAPSGVASQLLDLLKSFNINVESSSTSPPTTAPASSTQW